ncbi:MAG: 23S rRNA (uracil(1939)-C(5))-methyltransferase RlmD [Pyrinomonadaceae bacterium]|nr:23S rRNA (uracil(1939)-C(5))-methyltransferase RlmD [Pyrinomonadaceae bacterium]
MSKKFKRNNLRRETARTPTDKTLVVTIERIVPNGFGIAFAENLTVFVSLAVVGDVLRVRVDKLKKNIAFASIIEIITPSQNRVSPKCVYFGVCGGCDFQQMNYAAQLQAKVDIIKDCLSRIGKIDWQKDIEIIASPREFEYRTRVNWKRDESKFGYFKRDSHDICDVEICPILTEDLQKTLTDLRQDDAISNSIREIKAVSSESQISILLDENGNAFDSDENFYAANFDLSDKAAFEPQSKTARELNLKIGDFDYAFSAATFFQVNHQLLQRFIETALQDASGDFALDLYCGVGLFALPLSKKFTKVIGIEGSETSINLAKKNAANADLSNADFETASVESWLTKNVESLQNVDFILLDPPRTGAERETIDFLCALKPRRIVYVSCNPATLARDLRLLTAENYVIENITAFDFFPQTHHVETVVSLQKIVNN